MKYLIAFATFFFCSLGAFAQTEPLEEQIRSEKDLNEKITIRDVGSIHTASPLYIVDGVPVPVDSSILRTIKPDEIEAINVLKGEAATALYGSAGANGVIVVILKKKYTKKFQRKLNRQQKAKK